MKELSIGLQLPTYDDENHRPTRWNDLRALALAAEQIGIDTLWVCDHLIFQNGGRSIGFWESWTILSALAAVTGKIAIGPLVACTAIRHPALLAKMSDTLDEVSSGRLLLGLGSGIERSPSVTEKPELPRFGCASDHLLGRFEEAVQIIVRLLRQGQLDFEGTYYQVRDCELKPRGPSQKGPPVWIGASGPRMLQIAARWADALNINIPLTSPDVLSVPLAAFRDCCHQINRDPSQVLLSGYAIITFAGTGVDKSGRRSRAISGTPEDIAHRLHALHQAGVAHIQCVIDDGQQEHLSFWPILTMRGIEQFNLVIEALHKIESE